MQWNSHNQPVQRLLKQLMPSQSNIFLNNFFLVYWITHYLQLFPQVWWGSAIRTPQVCKDHHVLLAHSQPMCWMNVEYHLLRKYLFFSFINVVTYLSLSVLYTCNSFFMILMFQLRWNNFNALFNTFNSKSSIEKLYIVSVTKIECSLGFKLIQ